MPTKFLKDEQVVVPRHNHDGFACESSCEDHIIILIAANRRRQRLRPGEFAEIRLGGQSSSRGRADLMPAGEKGFEFLLQRV